MKALVAVGTDRRLRPLSSTTPAQLVPVAGRPALCYALDAIRKAGVDEACLVVGAGQRDVERAVGRGFDYGLDISYLRQDAPLGLGHCALIAREFLDGDDFVLYQGGVVLPDGIEDLVATFREQAADAMSLVDADGAQLGVHVFSPAVHQAVLAIAPRWNNTRDITDAIRWLADRGHVTGQHVPGGPWHDTGTAKGLLACNRTILGRIQAAVHGTVDDASELSGAILVEEGAQVSRSRITGPVIIGSYATVEDAVIGPCTSVGADCVIRGAQVESSILLSGAEVHGVRRISESVIGRGASVRPAPAGPGARRLILGDHSQILVEP
jgi:glucose-1-phosphate thymidylyltransferase